MQNVDEIRSLEIVGLLVDFLTEPRVGLVSLLPRRKMRAMNGTVNVLGLTSLSDCGPQLRLRTVCVPRRCSLSALADSTDESLERFTLRFRLARLMAGAHDCHGWAVEIGWDVHLKEIGEGNE